MSSRLITPAIAEFPQFLKNIESRWGLKLKRRFERECLAADRARANGQNKPARYILSMFPYPSGRLHLGHVRIYTSGDILARYSKLMSNNGRYPVDYSHVVHPMGFDSFGLPAENAAKERNLHPAIWTNSNIRVMKKQLDELALQFEWREATSNPSYYKWTQKIFLELMRAGLVYKSFAQVNWDPVDKTVLADEQVDENGRSWRSGAVVEKKYCRQWFIKVNAFTKDIYEAKDVNVETWLDILAIQRNWIGKPSGWLFYIPVYIKGNTPDILPVFTTKPEYFHRSDIELVISDTHWLCNIMKGSEINNPFTNQPIKVRKIEDSDSLPEGSKATLSAPHHDDSSDTSLVREQVLLQAKLNNLGGYFTSDKYRDWLISRQRFWGTPIPVVNCDVCGYTGVQDDQLPVMLPNIKNLSINPNQNQDQSNELKVVTPIELLAPPQWLETKCKSCGSKAKRECETFDTLFDSSWYFLRYASEPLDDQPFDKDKVQPVWCYIGGKEHASMHLFYARFITHFLHSIGKLDFREPFDSLLVQGVVKSRTYKLNGRYIEKSEADRLSNKKGLVVEYEKMSKSKGNGVDPQELLDTYGVDATRLCLMSYANPRSERLWRTSEEEFKDVLIFMRRVTLTVQEYVDLGVNLFKKENKNVRVKELDKDDLEHRKMALSDTLDKCSIDAIFYIQETNQFRQYISTMHVLTSTIRNNVKTSAVYTKEFAEALAALIIMLNPITPHLSEELWYHFSKSNINPLKMDTTSYLKMALQASDQAWPIPDRFLSSSNQPSQ
jgi:leucyl-tRNA synthetase